MTYTQSAPGYLAGSISGMILVARTASAPQSMSAAIRREVQGLDSNLPVYNIKTMEQHLAESIAWGRFNMLLLTAFAGVAVLLAVAGLYGVMSYMVSQRTHEIGLRMALGAQARDILGMAVRQGLVLIIIGIGVGLAGALALTRVMSGRLYGVGTTDPATFATIVLLLAFASLIACYIPARRATRVDPLVALRYE